MNMIVLSINLCDVNFSTTYHSVEFFIGLPLIGSIWIKNLLEHTGLYKFLICFFYYD